MWNSTFLGPILTAAVIAFSPGVALADDPGGGVQPDYTLFNPVPDSQLGPICTDRPTKSNGPCSVPAGHFQLESDLLNVTFQRTDGVTTDTYLFTDPTLKLGLDKTTDAEVSLVPLETVVTHDRVAGDSTLTGVGDLFARLKWNFIGADGGDVSIALSPYVKLPTARHGIGDGAVEEGLLIPAQITLPAGWSLTLNGEVDALKNQDDTGRHANYIGIVSFSHPLTKALTGSAEVWSDVDDDPSGTIRQYSFDLALAWIPDALPNLQFDGGLNIGLNDATPGAQVYVGVSRRY
jgi:hypothetical protein